MFGDWRPRAVVLDCDGLLVDTEGCWTRAERGMCVARGVAFTAADERALIGVSVPGACRMLAERFGDPAAWPEVERELLARVAEIVAVDATAMPGAPELVALARVRVPVAVASNSPRALLDQALARGGMLGAFDATVAADEVARAKPEPDLYLAACARLAIDPGDALALEDSATGVRAAAAAGLRTIAVPTPPGADIGAEVTLDGLADPGLVEWVDGWPLR